MSFERFKQGLETWLLQKLAPLDYDVLYPCTIVEVNSDGTVEVAADAEKVGTRSSVPVRYGLPGTSCVPTPGREAGARAFLGFDERDPKAPYVTGFVASAPAQVVSIDADEIRLGSGAAPVLRDGDTVEIYIFAPGKTVVATGIIGLLSGTAEVPPAASKVLA